MALFRPHKKTAPRARSSRTFLGKCFLLFGFLFRHWKGVLIAVIFWNMGWHTARFMNSFDSTLKQGFSFLFKRQPEATSKPKPRIPSSHQKNIHAPLTASKHSALNKTKREIDFETPVFRFSKNAQKLSELKTIPVIQKSVVKRIRLGGIVSYVPSRVKHVFSPFNGKLFNILHPYQNRQVNQGERIFSFVQGIHIYTPIKGILMVHKRIDHSNVKKGDRLFSIIDASQMHVTFHAHQRDLPWLRIGQRVELISEKLTDAHGTILRISPEVDAHTHSVSIACEFTNPTHQLKANMHIQAYVYASVNENGRVHLPNKKKIWTCPLHPMMRGSSSYHTCAICGSPVQHQSIHEASVYKKPLVIPDTAILQEDDQAHVYLEKKQNGNIVYIQRQVKRGPHIGNEFVILEGLAPGEKIVTQGALLLQQAFEHQHSSHLTHHSSTEIPPPKADLSHAFQAIYPLYFTLHNALARDQKTWSFSAFKQLEKTLHRLHFSSDRSLRLQKKEMLAIVKQAKETHSLQQSRTLFSTLSNLLLKWEEHFHHPGIKPFYLLHCSLAFEEKGAFWIQQSLPILNPYLGSNMPRCGRVKKRLPGKQSIPVRSLNKRFLSDLGTLYASYFHLLQSMIHPKWTSIQKASRQFYAQAHVSRHSSLSHQQKAQWSPFENAIRDATKQLVQSRTIHDTRLSFRTISQIILQIVHTFGHLQQHTMYEVYSPTALEKGAVWLQAQDQTIQKVFGDTFFYGATVRRRFLPKKITAPLSSRPTTR